MQGEKAQGEKVPAHAPMRDWGAKPWQRNPKGLTVVKPAKPTHKVTCEVLAGGRIKTKVDKTFTTEADAIAFASTQTQIKEATQFGWVETATLLGDDGCAVLEDMFWCDGSSPTRVTTRPV